MLINKYVLYAAEAAALLNCPVHVIYDLIRTRKLRAYKNPGGRAWHIPADAIQEYVNSCTPAN